jgi:hypothetical protein
MDDGETGMVEGGKGSVRWFGGVERARVRTGQVAGARAIKPGD